jgi:hypothetical protein
MHTAHFASFSQVHLTLVVVEQDKPTSTARIILFSAFKFKKRQDMRHAICVASKLLPAQWTAPFALMVNGYSEHATSVNVLSAAW